MNNTKRGTILIVLLMTVLIVSAKQLKDVYIRDHEDVPMFETRYSCTNYGINVNGSYDCISYSYQPETIYSQREKGAVLVDSMRIEYDGYWCSYQGDYEIHCVSLTDGYHEGEPAYCNKHGGMTCKIIKLYDFDKYKIIETNGEVPSFTKYKTGVLK